MDEVWLPSDRSASTLRTQAKDQHSVPWTSPPRTENKHNGVRKRHSFFGRSSTDTMTSRPATALHSTLPIPRDTGREPAARPMTGMSGESRRRKTDPLDNLRQSIFGSRRKPSVSNTGSLSSRASTRNESGREALPTLAHEHFATEEVSKKQLPPLETVAEKDLTAKFWAASAYQRPQRHLNGIEADDLDEKHRLMGITRGSPTSQPTSPVNNNPSSSDRQQPFGFFDSAGSNTIDETLFDGLREAKLNHDESSSGPTRLPQRHPRRFSSLGALNQQPRGSPLGERPTFYESNSSGGESEAPNEGSPYASPGVCDVSPPLHAVQEESDAGSSRTTSMRADPPSQPLPPIPTHNVKSTVLTDTPRSTASDEVLFAFSTLPQNRPTSTRSKRSSRTSSHSDRRNRAISSASMDARRPSVKSDATWEDDVDYLYQQEAEATCDFDWHCSTPARESSIAESDGVRLSAWIAPPPVPDMDNPKVLALQPTSDNIVINPTFPAVQSEHRRGSSVGHRGFLAARRGSTELAKRNLSVPPVLELTPGSTQVSILSPVFSVTGADDESPKTPFTPGALHLNGVDSVGRGSAEYLSDPESVRTGGSKHRKSSSYGSYESVARPAVGVHYGVRETVRWSFASSNSVPDLLHSRRKSRSSLHKSIISRPLESLPQSPDKATDSSKSDGTESVVIPRASQVEPMRNTFVIRRAETVGHRPTSRAAGRAGQRNRSTTPSRLSRVLPPEEAVKPPSDSISGGWI